MIVSHVYRKSLIPHGLVQSDLKIPKTAGFERILQTQPPSLTRREHRKWRSPPSSGKLAVGLLGACFFARNPRTAWSPDLVGGHRRTSGAQGIMQAAIFSPISGSGGGSPTGTGCRTQPIAPASSHPSGTPSLLRVARFPAMDCVYVRRCFQRNERVVPRRRGGSAPASKHRRRSSCGCSGCRPAHRAYASDSSAPARGAPPIRDNRPPSTVHTAPFTNDELE